MEAKRRVATVLFTDIVGSTERATQLGDRRWHELLQQHHNRVRRELRRCEGREIGTAGDGFLATFETPAQAIRCACAVRDGVRDLGLDVRCGLHMGEVEVRGRDLGGIGVHIGARVGAHAGAGEVLVSSTVRDAVEGSGFEFDDRGVHALKGVRGEWRLFAVSSVPEGEGVAEPGRWRLRLTRPQAMVTVAVGAALLFGLAGVYVLIRDRGRSLSPAGAVAGEAAPGIAVLPFTIRGAGLEVWEEGMVDLLSTNLDGVAGLRAIDSRTVLARWAEHVPENATADLATTLDVARRTGARYALVGSVVASGPGVRLSADLYDLQSGDGLVEARVEGAPEAIFGLVDRLSIEILRALLEGEESALATVSLARITSASLPALKAYLEGETFFRRSDFERAIPAYTRAVEIDTTFALALYRLGSAYRWEESYFSTAHRKYLERAARLAHRLPEREGLLVRGALALDRASLSGIAPLQQAVKKYPDDPEGWYLLGETYYHLGPRALIPQEESERAFLGAIQLDPSFTPAYIHVVEAAFRLHADSARAAKLIETYAKLAGNSESDRMNRLAFAMGFGGPSRRARAREALDSLPSPFLWVVAGNYFEHPRFRENQREILTVLVERPSDHGVALLSLFGNAMNGGKLKEGLAYLDRAQAPQPVKTFALFNVYIRGLPLPPELFERELALATADTSSWLSNLYASIVAADGGNRSAHAAGLARLRRQGERLRAEGDSTQARHFEEAAAALEGYGFWKRNERQRALRSLAALQPDADALNDVLRWWLAELLMELERPRDAERYFSSFWQDPLAAYRRGKIYEQLEDDEQAREAYAFFAGAWAGADAELQPLVQEARNALARLTETTEPGTRRSSRGGHEDHAAHASSTV